MKLSGKLIVSTVFAVAMSGSVLAADLNLYLIPSPSATAIKSFIPAFTEKTGTKVNVTEVPYGEAHQKLLLSVQLKQGQYDVAQFDNTFLAPYGAAGTMTPLDDYIKASAEYDIGDFESGQQDYGKYNGETLGLTLSTEPMIQWYRKDIYEKLGLKPAATWDEYKSNAIKIEEAKLGDGNLLGWGPNASWWWMTLVWSFGGKLYDENFVPAVNSPEAVEATTFFKEMMSYGPEGGISASGDDVTNKFFAQDIGAIIQYSGYWGVALDPANNAFVGKLATAPMPRGKTDITHLAGWNIGIPADSQNKDAAWQFMEFVLGKSNSVAYLKAGAAAIGRKSISSNEELLKLHPYLPAESRIERYPQIRTWPEVEKAILDALPAILNGEVEVKAGLDTLNETLKPILAQEKAN